MVTAALLIYKSNYYHKKIFQVIVGILSGMYEWINAMVLHKDTVNSICGAR